MQEVALSAKPAAFPGQGKRPLHRFLPQAPQLRTAMASLLRLVVLFSAAACAAGVTQPPAVVAAKALLQGKTLRCGIHNIRQGAGASLSAQPAVPAP